MRRRLSFVLRILGTLLFVAILWFGYLYIYGNFHKVDENVYRSAQLFSFNMPYYLEKYGIRTVINLRKPEPAKEWYKNEIAYAKEHNITHIDFPLPDRRLIPPKKLATLVHIMKNAPKPLLLHCKAGADRTSLASALYLYAIKGDANASRAISLRYGHFPYLGSKTKAMDESFLLFTREYPLGAPNATR